MAATRDFADYCCELLASIGPCTAKRMFGGWGLAQDGLMIAIIADLGDGEKLWLKADPDTIGQFETARCQRFCYASHKAGAPVQRSMNYYCAPVDAMDSALAMAPWARLALDSARKALRATPQRKPPARRRSGNGPPRA